MLNMKKQVSKPSRLWYLLPIFLGIIGGIIGYFAVRDRDKKMANRLLILPFILIIVTMFLAGILAVFVSNYTKQQLSSLPSEITSIQRTIHYINNNTIISITENYTRKYSLTVGQTIVFNVTAVGNSYLTPMMFNSSEYQRYASGVVNTNSWTYFYYFDICSKGDTRNCEFTSPKTDDYYFVIETYSNTPTTIRETSYYYD
jgi:hypothetical protein